MPASSATVPLIRRARQTLVMALFALGTLYLLWFRHDPHRLAVLLVFVLPPFGLCLGVSLRRANAPFWAGVAALFWFAHAVMAAWVEADVRGLAWTGIGLSLVIVVAASLPGLHARFARRV